MKRSSARGAALFLFVGTLFGIASLACEDTSPPAPCFDIPLGGCPASEANVCADPSCFNVFECVAGEWKFVESCPAQDAAPPANDAASDAHASLLYDANEFDAPPGANGGPGCTDLEPTDCALGLALACTNTDCCGCTDLFVCQDGGWIAWGSCGDGGITQG